MHTAKPAGAGTPFSKTRNEGQRTDEEANEFLNTCGKELVTRRDSPLETLFTGGDKRANTRRKNKRA